MKFEDADTPYSVLYVRKDGFVNTGGGVFETKEDAVSAVDRLAASNTLDNEVDVVIILDRRQSHGVAKYGKVIPPPEPARSSVAWRT